MTMPNRVEHQVRTYRYRSRPHFKPIHFHENLRTRLCLRLIWFRLLSTDRGLSSRITCECRVCAHWCSKCLRGTAWCRDRWRRRRSCRLRYGACGAGNGGSHNIQTAAVASKFFIAPWTARRVCFVDWHLTNGRSRGSRDACGRDALVHDHVVVSRDDVVNDGGVVKHLIHLMTRNAVAIVTAAVPVIIGNECERIPRQTK